MEPLIKYLNAFMPIPEKDKSFILSCCSARKLKAEEFFLGYGAYCHEIGFVVQGLARSFFITPEGAEVTHYFHQENHFLVSLESYSQGIPSAYGIQAITECRLLVFQRSDFDLLEERLPYWNKLARMITEKGLLDKVFTHQVYQNAKAALRYEQFISNEPALALQVPLKYIASYLGITQQSLSRIRRSLSQPS